MSPVLSTFSGASARAFGFGYATGALPSDFEHIETQTVGSTSVASVTFSSIPSGYKHLQVRSISRLSSGGVATMYVRFNSDSGNNYRQHYIYGDGAIVASGTSSTSFSLAGTSNGSTSTSNSFGASVIDILDYRDTSKYTTLRSISGADSNGSGFFQFFSSLWLSTAAITSLTFVNSGAPNFVQHSTFSLYGIK